jgi:hypothetical protein
MSDRRWQWIFWSAAACLALGGAAGGVYWWWQPKPQPSPEVEPILEREVKFPLPGYSKSRYLNTAADVEYIGAAACAGCHRSNHQSYMQTAHSRALVDVEADAEPQDGSFEHKPMGRSYRVYRKDGLLRHAEIVQTADGKEIARVDHPVRYLVGSGNFSRTYLIEVDGYLYESPITYYASTKRWGLSPGYDTSWNAGFERPIDIKCLVCHAGRARPSSTSAHAVTFQEQAIGCESCHGPGALHRDLRASKKGVPVEEDLTIVNPAKLSRSLQEDICAFCHLNGQVAIWLRGRERTDFRPGLPLSDFRVHYRFEPESEQMTVVGHVEQLRLSACYQKSALTCLTCHDPHRRRAPKDAIAYYRQKCLECHADSATEQSKDGGHSPVCRLDPAERRKMDKADNCVACHMPRGDTEIPHIAFTHHRIGVHGRVKPATGRTPVLAAIEDLGHLSPIDRQRNLGLAYLEAAELGTYPALIESFHDRGRQLLEDSHAQGLRDGISLQLLGAHYAPLDAVRTGRLARETLAMKSAPLSARGSALLNLGRIAMREREFSAAIERFQEFNKLYRNADGMYFLGACYLELKQPDRALPPLAQALAMRPFSPAMHDALAEAYRQLGKNQLALEHLEKAKTLKQLGQK